MSTFRSAFKGADLKAGAWENDITVAVSAQSPPSPDYNIQKLVSPLGFMPSLAGEAMAVLHLMAAAAWGAVLGGAEAATAAAVGMAVAGLGSVVVMVRRLAAREVAVVDWEVEMAAAAAAVRREVMNRQVLAWVAEREEGRRWTAERVRVGGG